VADPDLPSTCTLLISPNTGVKVYLIGTAHFSKESCEDVATVIQAVQPDVVMVELCKSRTNILHLDEATILEEAQNLDMEKSLEILKSHGTVQGVMYLLLLSMSAHLTKELGMAPGGEFRRAFIEAMKVPGCKVHLGDRPINITLKRALAALGTLQKLRLGWNILTSKDSITREEVEKCKDRDLLENMLAEMAGEFPALSRVFVAERDLFLAHSLQLAAEGPGAGGGNVVAVVGIGHVPGMVEHWGKVTTEQVKEVVKLEPPSLLGRVIRLTVKTAIWGGCLYGAYRITRGPVSRLLLVR
jgi:pheromone shutdown-related protein TraB